MSDLEKLLEGYVPYKPGMPSTIPQEEKDRRLRAAVRLKERRSSHPFYGRMAAEARERGGEEAEMQYWLNLQGSAVLAD